MTIADISDFTPERLDARTKLDVQAFQAPPYNERWEPGAARAMLEQLAGLADARGWFLMAFDDAVKTLSDPESRAIWQNLPAVRAGNVYRVRQGNWLATSLLADEQRLRDVRAALVGEGP